LKKVELLPNIKFDSIINNNISILNRDLGNIRLHKDNKLLVLASVRKEEEEQISRIIEKILLEMPDTVIALFPRHMHRIKKWQKILTRLNCKWTLKSKTETEILPGTVILWDGFGELASVYSKADAAFVGGSLARLGGQNFIEPISCGIIPVIGPYWDDFSWIGKEIFRNGLAIEGKNWQETAESLIRILRNPEKKTIIISKALDYFHKKRGGSEIACKVILEAMQ
jgi:3-deoxy-D-manno-octulosonic-acid transferase